MGRLLLLFIVVPFVELLLLIEIGRWIGTPATLGLIVATGALGAWLARRQGLGVLRRLQEETAAGGLPAGPVFDGVLVLVAGAVLLTPGLLTDLFGFFCLIPAGRRWLRKRLRGWLEGAVERGRVKVSMGGRSPFGGGAPPMRDVTPRGSSGAAEADRDRLPLE